MTLVQRVEDFPLLAPLEAAHREIYQEYLGVRRQLEDWVERDLYNADWKTFRLFEFPNGEPVAENIRQCPLTAKLIESCFPRHGAGGFSFLGPGTRIAPHEGYQGEFLRCHLGLTVPPGDCCLQLGSTTTAWEEGKVLIFDDRKWHAAWNNTSSERVVLLVDFIP